MNQDNTGGSIFLEGRAATSDLKGESNENDKEKHIRKFGVLKAKPDSKVIMGPGTTYEQCFSGGNFASQYEDECPVNYSLKYSETESCKGGNKCENGKKKFKDYADFPEPGLDQPTDFSLKYAEKTYDEENKSTTPFSYFTTHKVKFKEYADFAETDVDQPTDFTLKYRESAEEDVKNLDFFYYENEERKGSAGFDPRRARGEDLEDAPCERLPERYASQNETPLMFSRSSSMNSLSSFVHITQSIPDDRSSIVSDFSRMTSGIISPSELPDSPTQTAPSSPKRHKPPFSGKSDFLTKQSVFEDDVATYKQEDTPMEFSRTTSLSSLNLENPVRSELAIKRNVTTLTKEEGQYSANQVQPDYLKQQQTPLEKTDHEKGKFELASVDEVDESLCNDYISIDSINCRKTKTNESSQEDQLKLRQTNGFPAKSNLRLRLHGENRKGYAAYEGSDDAIHTYHTEGTPANVSHAGSHSDLSTLSMASGIPFFLGDDNSDNESFFQGVTNAVSTPKPQLDYLRKDHQLTAKDETATFATENSPCDFSARSSLNDLTVNVLDPPLSINRAVACEEPPSQMLSPLRNVSPQSPNSIVYEEVEDAEKRLEEPQSEFILPQSMSRGEDDWNEGEEKSEKNLQNDSDCSKSETVVAANFEFDSEQPLSPLEEALLEECIRLGMPPKKNHKQQQETRHKLNDEGKPSEDFSFSKSSPNKSKCLSEKKTPSNCRPGISEMHATRPGKDSQNVLNGDSLDFDTSEPLTLFEEVLLQQCIRLGMPQKKSRQEKSEEADVKYLNEEIENFDCDSAGITPLETTLLEQCIRLGMPQKKTQKREGNATSEEPHKALTCLTAHLNRLKLNSESEKDKDPFKKSNESCPCGKKHNRRKGTNCKKKNRLDHLKVESCPV